MLVTKLLVKINEWFDRFCQKHNLLWVAVRVLCKVYNDKINVTEIFDQCCFTLITMLPKLLPQNPFFRIKIDTFLSILFENPKIEIFILELVRTLSIELKTSCDWESDLRIFED